MTNVLAYCTQPILGAGLGCVLDGIDNFHLLECCTTPDSLYKQAKQSLPNILLVETTPAITLDFLQELVQVSGGAQIILWVEEPSLEFLSQTLGIGVRGMLRKHLPIEAHVQCLLAVSSGEVWMDTTVANGLLTLKRVQLTVRERQLIGFVAQGRKNKDIANLMGISEGTVKVYLSRLFPKVGAQDRLSLALMGLRNVRSSQRNSQDKIGPASTSRLLPLAIPQFLSTESVAA